MIADRTFAWKAAPYDAYRGRQARTPPWRGKVTFREQLRHSNQGEDSNMPVSSVWHAGTLGRVLAFVLAYALASGSRAGDLKLNIVTEEWAPYSYSDGNVLTGFSVEVVRSIAESLKADIEIQLLPSLRTSVHLERDRRTMQITMLRTAEREFKYKWIGPLDDVSIYFYKKKGSPLAIATLEDAKKVDSICSRQAGLVRSRLNAEGFRNLDASSYEGKAVYRMLIFGRCDLAVSDAPLGVTHALRRMGYPLDAVVQTPVKILESQMYIACSKDIPDAEIARWQAALDQLKSSGALQAMRKRYVE